MGKKRGPVIKRKKYISNITTTSDFLYCPIVALLHISTHTQRCEALSKPTNILGYVKVKSR
jgi:hypothetical protein